MASKDAVRKAMNRGYNVRTVECQCPSHATGQTTVIPPQAGKTVMMNATDYGYFCKECYNRQFEARQQSFKAGQNAMTGQLKATVNSQTTVQFSFTTGRQDIMQVCKANGYGIKALKKGYRITSIDMTNINGIMKQWQAFKLPHNIKINWTIKDSNGNVIGKGIDNKAMAISNARMIKGTI